MAHLRCLLFSAAQMAGPGDVNVPNALMFIDKYNQVSRILNPIVLTIKAIPRLCSERKDIKLYVDTIFGGANKLKMIILTDFFRSVQMHPLCESANISAVKQTRIAFCTPAKTNAIAVLHSNFFSLSLTSSFFLVFACFQSRVRWQRRG